MKQKNNRSSRHTTTDNANTSNIYMTNLKRNYAQRKDFIEFNYSVEKLCATIQTLHTTEVAYET